MAAISSGVAKPALSKITETRYCILGHLLWFGAPLVGGRSPKVGEVLLVSNVGRSWPYGWNRSVIYCVTYVTCSGVARPLHTAGARPAGRPGSLCPSGRLAIQPGQPPCPGRCRGTAPCPC